MDSYTNLEISLIESAGPILHARAPYLFYYFHALRLMDGDIQAKALLLHHSFKTNKWEKHSRDISQEEINQIVSLLSEIGIPGKELRVTGVFDTSDSWRKLLLNISLNEQTYSLNLDMLASGFEGEDADQLHRLLTKLLALVGLEFGTPSNVWSLSNNMNMPTSPLQTPESEPKSRIEDDIARREKLMHEINELESAIQEGLNKPDKWFCIYCGWQNEPSDVCAECQSTRPSIELDKTIKKCQECAHWNLGLAKFCEWCGCEF